MRYIAYGLAIFAAMLTVAFAIGFATALHNETNSTMNVLQFEQASDAKVPHQQKNP